MTTLIGVDILNPVTAAELTQGKGFGLGDRHIDQTGNEYVYVQAGVGGITANFVATIDEAYAAVMVSTSNDARGDLLGVALATIAANSFGWVQVKGVCNVQVAASCAANVRLNTTATAGQLDDDGTAGSITCDGIVLTTARGAGAGTAPGVLNYAIQGVTI
jgi:hypothetical protein